MTGAELVIDLAAFRANVAHLASIAAPARTMLAVKANAYGHGLLPLARAALEAGADSLAVLDVTTALAVRRAGITAPLFAWLHGVDTDFGGAIDAEVDLGVSATWQLEAIAAAGRSDAARVHLKVDTGLHRNGARPEDWPALVSAALAAQDAGAVRIVGLWSHLADASPADDAVALERFLRAVEVARGLGCRPDVLHLAASSAGIREPEARFDLVRFGIAAYGISPFDDETASQLGLRAVMTMRAPVREVDGDRVIVAVGSADGVNTPAAGRAFVALHGRRHRVLEIGIDTVTVDRDGAAIDVGAIATLFGPGDEGEPSAEDWAGWAGTIGDEIVAHTTSRIARTYRE